MQELRKISQDRDRAWESELEAVQKQHSMDSATLASAVNEIQKLKVQLEKAYESEDIQTKHVESAHFLSSLAPLTCMAFPMHLFAVQTLQPGQFTSLLHQALAWLLPSRTSPISLQLAMHRPVAPTAFSLARHNQLATPSKLTSSHHCYSLQQVPIQGQQPTWTAPTAPACLADM